MKRDLIRRILVWGGLAVAVLASIAASKSPVDDSAAVVAPVPVARTEAMPDTADKLPGLALQRLTRSEWATSDADPFRAKSWYVAPPAPPPPPPPPKPTAPPLPFKYMGALEDTSQNGKTVVYLAKGNDSYQVAVGDNFADGYQLEKIERGQLVIRYLPLSILQTLSTGWTE